MRAGVVPPSRIRVFLGGGAHVVLEAGHVVRDEQEGVVERLERLVLGVVRVVLPKGVQAGEQLVGGRHGSAPGTGEPGHSSWIDSPDGGGYCPGRRRDRGTGRR